MDTRSYVCPNCGAPMEFDSGLQKMHCSHCENTMTVDEIENYYRELDRQYDHESTLTEEDDVDGVFEETAGTGDFKVYRCQGCGAEILTEEHTAATFCSFCGRPSMMEDRLTGQLMPSVLIPFKIKKEGATEIYTAWSKKGLLTPSKLKSQATIEKITGIYVPFWLYDYNAEIQVSAKCTRTRSETRGDYRYVHTDHFMAERDIETEYLKIPVDASEKMPDDVMDKLEPFSYSDLTGFEMAFLSGYYAEKYNYDSNQMAPRAENRVRQYVYQTAMNTINGYSSVTVVNRHTKLGRRCVKYALLPVWILNYKYKNKDYMFAMNGQTGKIVADRPISTGKMAGWFSGILLGIFTVLQLIGRFLI